MARPMRRGISVNPIFLFKNLSTAHSLAAFKTVGALPPFFPAYIAILSPSNTSKSGFEKFKVESFEKATLSSDIYRLSG